jgi:ribonuclease BN (tRNA processing enzyme)
MVLESDDGHKLLIDCGFRSQDMLEDHYGIGNADLADIEGVYVTHLHADHVGGLEWLALCTHFNLGITERRKLFCEPTLMKELWNKSLQGGLETIQGDEATLTTYFECVSTPVNEHFVWRGLRLWPVQVVHVVSGFSIKHCYGLMIEQEAPVAAWEAEGVEAQAAVNAAEPNSAAHIGATRNLLEVTNRERTWKRSFLTADTQFAPSSLRTMYDMADVIFHDCEITSYPSGVHAHYDELKTLPADVKKKMSLYHYHEPTAWDKGHEDGFASFIQVGDSFDL